MNIIDISRDILDCEIYPGDPVPRVEIVKRISDGDSCNLAAIYTGLHCGTHMDAPLHFIDKGMPIDMLPLDAFIGECTVISVPSGPITGEYVEKYFPRSRERIIIKGGGRAYFHETAASELAIAGVKLVGTDSLSVGTHGAQTAVHKAFLREAVALLEGLKLDEVEDGDYFLIAPPLKIGGVEAAPVRALLISDYLFWSA
ncbi:MAG: cyclase family protein [Clostridiales bacterium]|jgi:arylformamidase|nr:cyclase family protein [Clostridiales bacterium]